MASRFMCLRRLVTAPNSSTFIGRACVSVSVSVSSLRRRPVSAFYRTFGTVKKILGNEKTYHKIFNFDNKNWCTILNPPPSDWSRDQIIDFYLETLAKVVGSLEEARMKMYSVSTEDVFHFRAHISKEQSKNLSGMECVKFVIPDVYDDDELKQSDCDLYEDDQLQQSQSQDDELQQPACTAQPDCVAPQQSQREPHILDSICYDYNPALLERLRADDPDEIEKSRKSLAAKLKSSGLDDGAIKYLLRNTRKGTPAKKNGDCQKKEVDMSYLFNHP